MKWPASSLAPSSETGRHRKDTQGENTIDVIAHRSAVITEGSITEIRSAGNRLSEPNAPRVYLGAIPETFCGMC
ncbi:hypothetical protein ACOMHN_047303 [Nucella lapillus]